MKDLNLKPYLKAYKIKWLPTSNEAVVMGWIDHIVCAETEKLARMKALHQLREYDIEEDHFGNEFNYISIRLKRDSDHDLFLIDGKIKSREEIEYDNKKAERDDEFRKLLADNPSAYCYIKKGGYYYRPNSCGYTEFKTQAGIYPIKQAVNECLGMSIGEFMRPILIDVLEHNNIIHKQVEELRSRLIQSYH